MPCYVEHMSDGGTMFLCGDLGQHCRAERCAAVGGYLCDWPIAPEKTCDLPLCASHALEVAPGVHYCQGHALLWTEFRDAGGVEAVLQNVVPFPNR